MKNKFMNLAYKEALKAYAADEVPIGCVLVKDGEVIAKAHNHKVRKNSAIHHAEIECIEKATKKLNTWHLDDVEMYVTLEPCLMCAGAIINSRIKKVFFATRDPKGGAFGSNVDVTKIEKLNHYPEYECGEMEKECSSLLKEFFKQKR